MLMVVQAGIKVHRQGVLSQPVPAAVAELVDQRVLKIILVVVVVLAAILVQEVEAVTTADLPV